MIRYFPFFIFFLLASPVEPRLPELTPRDVKNKMGEILKTHATHQKFTPELIARTFENYLHELDPTKTYFLESEVEPWTSPTEEMLDRGLAAFRRADFSAFQEIDALMAHLPQPFVFPWRNGALGLLPFVDAPGASHLATRLQDELPEYLVRSAHLDGRELLAPSGSPLRSAIAAA